MFCPLDLMVGPPLITIEEGVCSIQYIEGIKSKLFCKHLGVAAIRQKEYYDKNLQPRSYEVSNWVWRYYPPIAGLKLGCGWTGPYLVVEKRSRLTY